MSAPDRFSVAGLVFVKAPDPGAVKTRLGPRLDAGRAAVLAARMALRTVGTMVEAGFANVIVHGAPAATHPFFSLLRQRHGVRVEPQAGDDLGERMHRALASALTDHDAAVLVGTDIPAMRAGDLAQAARHLERGADAVLGPALDGGFWLVGLRRADPALFSGISWGSAQTLEQTLAAMRARALQVELAPTRWDVDRPEDLDRIAADPSLRSLLEGLEKETFLGY